MRDYIGDGVYVEFDGFGIELRANSPDSPHVVYLEPQVLEALNRFAKRCAAQQSVQADLLPCGHSSDNLGNFGGCNPMGSCVICDAATSR